MITHLVQVPIFLRSVFFVGGCSHIEAMDAIYRLKGRKTRCELPDNAEGAVRTIGGDVYCWVKDLDRGSIVIHELTHVSLSIMEACGIPQCRDTEEVHCYLCGWLKLNVLDKVLEKKLKKEKQDA